MNKDNIYFIGLKVSVLGFRLVSGDAHCGRDGQHRFFIDL